MAAPPERSGETPPIHSKLKKPRRAHRRGGEREEGEQRAGVERESKAGVSPASESRTRHGRSSSAFRSSR